MKAIWKGSITFALLNIPVKVYAATHRKDISFHLLHKKDSTPIQYLKWCPSENKEVSWEDIVHGYEYQKRKFVTLADQELESLPQRASKSITIEEFVEGAEIEPVFYDRAYLLEPTGESSGPYGLLREAMKRTGKVAVARFTMKDREHFCVIRPYGDALLLATLHYPDEIMKSDQLQIPQTEPGKSELSLATELINKFSGKFTPENFRDSYREALMELIEAKIAGRQIAVPPPPRPAKVISLMDALKKSLERASPKRPKAGRPAAPKSLKRKTAKAAKAHP